MLRNNQNGASGRCCSNGDARAKPDDGAPRRGQFLLIETEHYEQILRAPRRRSNLLEQVLLDTRVRAITALRPPEYMLLWGS